MSFRSFIAEKLRFTLKYHDRLNPKLWRKDQLDPAITRLLLKQTMKFAKFSGVPAERIHDIVLTGGNANFNYTKFSDIDVHLECDLRGISEDRLYEKKVAWTLANPGLQVAGYTLEFYCANEQHPFPKGQGIYSLVHDKWLIVPRHLDSINVLKDPATEEQIRYQMNYIRKHLLSKKGTKQEILNFKEKMWKGRSAGLQHAGEFSIENVIYKELRNRGLIDKLNQKLKDME